MITSRMGRRRFIGAGLAISALSSIAGRAAFAQESGNIRMIWWGGDERSRRTEAAVDLFRKSNPNIAIQTESMGWDDYWARLATQVAGGNAPDFIQMDYRYMFEYARRGAIRPLDEFMGKELQIADFGQANLDSCSMDGKLYGGNVGVNAYTLLLDSAAWAEAGVEPPAHDMTWDGFKAKCADFVEANKRPRVYATADGSCQEALFEAWLRSQGKALYTSDGDLGFDGDDAGRWFAYWAEMREAGYCVPADVQALYKFSPESSPIVLRRAATDFGHSNQFVAFQTLFDGELTITGTPVTDGGAPAQYFKPSQLFAISSGAKNPAAVARLINFLIREPDGAKLLGLDRGVPASPEIRDVIMPELDDTGRKVVQFIEDMTPRIGLLPPSPPQGAGEVNDTMIRISQEVGFEALTPEQGGANFVDEAAAILKRG